MDSNTILSPIVFKPVEGFEPFNFLLCECARLTFLKEVSKLMNTAIEDMNTDPSDKNVRACDEFIYHALRNAYKVNDREYGFKLANGLLIPANKEDFS